MSRDEQPKSAYELAMEKLRRKDAEQGVEPTRLTDAQKEEIAGIRRFYGSKIAEREILHQAELRKARASGDPEAVAKAEESYRRDRGFFESEMESKIESVRAGKTAGSPGEPAE